MNAEVHALWLAVDVMAGAVIMLTLGLFCVTKALLAHIRYCYEHDRRRGG